MCSITNISDKLKKTSINTDLVHFSQSVTWTCDLGLTESHEIEFWTIKLTSDHRHLWYDEREFYVQVDSTASPSFLIRFFQITWYTLNKKVGSHYIIGCHFQRKGIIYYYFKRRDHFLCYFFIFKMHLCIQIEILLALRLKWNEGIIVNLT